MSEIRWNLVRDSITAAAEDAVDGDAGLWALMGRGGNRIWATADRCPGNPDRPTGICRYNRDPNRRRSLSAPTPFPNVFHLYYLSIFPFHFLIEIEKIKYKFTWSLKRSRS